MYKITWKYIIDDIEHEESYDDIYNLNLRLVSLTYHIEKESKGRSYIITVEKVAKIV